MARRIPATEGPRELRKARDVRHTADSAQQTVAVAEQAREAAHDGVSAAGQLSSAMVGMTESSDADHHIGRELARARSCLL